MALWVDRQVVADGCFQQRFDFFHHDQKLNQSLVRKVCKMLKDSNRVRA